MVLITRQALVQKGTSYLQERLVPDAKREAEDLLAACLGLPRLSLFLDPLADVDEAQQGQFAEWIHRRGNREPYAYIVGEISFFGTVLAVNPHVLIPRPETEILAAMIAQAFRHSSTEKILWDLCCGSGCLGISLKKHFPPWKVSLSDLSAEALQVAKGNAQRNGVDVDLLQGDLFEPFEGKQADLLVCNPPYLAESEYEETDPEVHFEPRQALVAGEAGLELYARIAADLPRVLAKGGSAWLEIGFLQGKPVADLFSQIPGMSCRILPDWSGKDRFAVVASEDSETVLKPRSDDLQIPRGI